MHDFIGTILKSMLGIHLQALSDYAALLIEVEKRPWLIFVDPPFVDFENVVILRDEELRKL